MKGTIEINGDGKKIPIENFKIGIDMGKGNSIGHIHTVRIQEEIELTPEMVQEMRRQGAELITNIPPRGSLAYQGLLFTRQLRRLLGYFLAPVYAALDALTLEKKAAAIMGKPARCGCGDPATSMNGHIPECYVCREGREQAERKSSPENE